MIETADVTLTGLHWLRPQWLWALLVLATAAFLWWYRESRTVSVWNSAIDEELRPYVLEGENSGSRLLGLMFLLSAALAVLILAGPVFEQEQRPVVEARRAEVLVIDLTRSMYADDLAPDRISRARFKIADLLNRAGDDRIGLVAFAERPYVISPLTDDVQTLLSFLPSLEPELMPAQGSRLDLAIDLAWQLLEGAGVTSGHVVLVTDASPNAAAVQMAERVANDGHRLSVLAVGTPTGVPLKDDAGGFVNDAQGQIVIPQLDLAALSELASAGGGEMTSITSDDQDVETLEGARRRAALQGSEGETTVSNGTATQWIERGPWLVPLLALLSLYLFRRGVAS